jgi:hypothetical protein
VTGFFHLFSVILFLCYPSQPMRRRYSVVGVCVCGGRGTAGFLRLSYCLHCFIFFFSKQHSHWAKGPSPPLGTRCCDAKYRLRASFSSHHAESLLTDTLCVYHRHCLPCSARFLALSRLSAHQSERFHLLQTHSHGGRDNFRSGGNSPVPSRELRSAWKAATVLSMQPTLFAPVCSFKPRRRPPS